MDYKFRKACIGYAIIAKFPGMRKEKDFCIYNSTDKDKYIYLQSDKSCLAINKETKQAVYSNKGSAPMDYYLRFKPTHKFEVEQKLIDDIMQVLGGDERTLADGSQIMSFS